MIDADTHLNGLKCSFGLGGQITTWLACGPLPAVSPDDPSQHPPSHIPTWGFEHDFLAELGGEASASPKRGDKIVVNGDATTWRPLFSPSARIDLRKGIADQDWTIAYLACEIHMPNPWKALFYLGSQGVTRLWINGRLYVNSTLERNFDYANETFWADLQPGANRCLVKLENRTGAWPFCLVMVREQTERSDTHFIQLPGDWQQSEARGLLTETLNQQWLSCVDARSYFGKAQVVFRLPKESGYPLALAAEMLNFRLVGENSVVAQRKASVEEILDSPRVIHRSSRRELSETTYKAELIISNQAVTNTCTLRHIDHVEPSPHRFTQPSLNTVRQRIDLLHAESERHYCGDGIWDAPRILGKHFPVQYRHTAWRVRAYCRLAAVEDQPIYKERAIEGANYLLSEQEGDGSFLWWFGQWGHDRDGHPGSQHLLALSGWDGMALADAYRLTGRIEFLEGSRRAAEWAIRMGHSGNTNYTSAEVEQCCENYRDRLEPALLDAALRLTINGVYPNQRPSGDWGGHNSWIWYHSLVVRGLASLRPLLPEGHYAIPELNRRLIAAVNHIIAQIQPDGQVFTCSDIEGAAREEGGHRPLPPIGFGQQSLQALVMAHDFCDLPVEEAIYGLMMAPMPLQKDGTTVDDSEGHLLMSMALAYQWFVSNNS